MLKPLRNLFKSSRSDSEKEITRLYNLYKEPFISYILKNNKIDEETVSDIYHESFLILFRDIKSGKIENLYSASLKTYLFSIGKKKTLKYFEKQKRLSITAEDELYKFMNDSDDSPEWLAQQKIARELVSQMEDLCKRILMHYYWDKKSMREIAEHMNYKDEQGAKNRKLICMRKLKIQLKDRFRKEGWI